MDQTLSNKEEPLFQLLNVDPKRDRIDMRRRCPFVGLSHDAETVMAFPTHRNHCHRVKNPESVRIDYQSTYCLTFTHRHCPVLLEKSVRVLPPEIAVQPSQKRSTTMAVSFAIVAVLMAVGLLLFGGLQWASASDWFANPDSAPAQHEVIESPDQQQVSPTVLPATELLLNDAPPDNLPEPILTTIPSSGN